MNRGPSAPSTRNHAVRTQPVTRRGTARSPLLGAVVLLLAAGILFVVLFAQRGPGTTGTPDSGANAGASGSTFGNGATTPGKGRVPVGEAVETILDAAQQSIRGGRHEDAAAMLAEGVRTYPEQQPLRVAYAETLVALSRPAEAYEQFVAALSIGPRAPETEFAAGTMARLTERPQLALEHYAAAQASDPGNPIYPLYLAQVQRAQGQTEEAKASLLRVVNLQPENAIAWGTLADIWYNENKLDLATQHIAKARTLEPLVGTWRLVEARILKRQSKPDQALLVMEALSDVEKRDLHNARLIAECHAMRGEMEQAVTGLTRASDGSPMDPELAIEAAIWLQRTDQIERAREYARRAQMLGSDRASAILADLSGDPATGHDPK